MLKIADDQKCQYAFLGNSGLRVSNICLGTATFGDPLFEGMPGQLSEEASHQMMDRFVEWGGNFIDTSNIYGYGTSEKILGSWLAGQQRDRFVIATKLRFPLDPADVNARGLGRRHVMQSVEVSLKRLQTDFIDLYQIHLWDDAVPLEETLRALEDLVRCGKVRYLGASNVSGWQMQKIVDLTRHMGFSPFVSLQQQYNLVSRSSELEPFQVCKLNGVGVLPWSPLKGGFLTGKVQRGQMPREGRLGWSAPIEAMEVQSAPSWSAVDKPQHWSTLDTVEKIATARGRSVAQVSLRWLLQKPVVSSVIIGATKLHQLDDNMAAANGWTLTEQEMKELDEVSKPDIPYPYEMIWQSNTMRRNPWHPSPYV